VIDAGSCYLAKPMWRVCEGHGVTRCKMKAVMLAVCSLCLLGSCSKPGSPTTADKDGDPVWHIEKLRQGDFHRRVDHRDVLAMTAMEPYHVWRLIEIGPSAGPHLVGLLEDETLTPFKYYGSPVFAPSGARGTETGTVDRTATLGDVADYALRRIYEDDVGYRSYLGQPDRSIAVARWRQIVAERAGAGRERGATSRRLGTG